jgi:hypothetical protein
MTSNTPVRASGASTFAHRVAAVWADIRYAQRRVAELNRPLRPHR